MAFTLKLSTAKFRLVFNIRKIKCAECGTKVPFLRKKKACSAWSHRKTV